MAAPNYSHDLVNISVADALGTWVEAVGFTDGTAPIAESDYYIQLTSGTTGCISKPMGNPTTAASGSIFNNAAGITITAPNAVFAWIYFAAPNALAIQTNGGLRFLVGSSNGAFKQYYIRGSDTYAYGG